MNNITNIQQNLMEWTRSFCPYLFSIMSENNSFWDRLSSKFCAKLDNASLVIESAEKIETENSIPILLGKAVQGEEIFILLLDFIDHQVKFLYESVPARLKDATIGLFERLLLEFDILEQHKPNPTYLNGLSEILTINKLLESGEYTLVEIEEPLGNGKCADFTLVKNGETEKTYVEVVNIHVDSSRVEEFDNFKLFMDARLRKKYDDKTNGLSHLITKKFLLSPCVWSEDSVTDFIEQYGALNHLTELNTLPPTSLVQYTNGSIKGFHFGIIKKEDL